jgi:hypothetical protein
VPLFTFSYGVKTMFLTPSVRFGCRSRRVLFSLVCSVFFPFFLAAQPVGDAAVKSEKELKALEHLSTDIKGILEEPKVRDAYIGVAILSVGTGEMVFEQNASKGFIPASNQDIGNTWSGVSIFNGSGYERQHFRQDP